MSQRERVSRMGGVRAWSEMRVRVRVEPKVRLADEPALRIAWRRARASERVRETGRERREYEGESD